jgi:hypothetical protein
MCSTVPAGNSKERLLLGSSSVVRVYWRCIVHIRDMTPGQSFIDAEPRRLRLALVSVGHADGFPRSWHPKTTLHAIVGEHRCPVTAPFIGPAGDRRYRFAKCQSGMEW